MDIITATFVFENPSKLKYEVDIVCRNYSVSELIRDDFYIKRALKYLYLGSTTKKEIDSLKLVDVKKGKVISLTNN